MTTTMTQAECLDAIIDTIGVDVTSKESAAIDRILTQFVTDTKRALVISSTAKVAEIIEQAYAGVVK